MSRAADRLLWLKCGGLISPPRVCQDGSHFGIDAVWFKNCCYLGFPNLGQVYNLFEISRRLRERESSRACTWCAVPNVAVLFFSFTLSVGGKCRVQKEKPCAGVPRAEKAGHRASFASRERVKGDVRHVLGGWQYSYCHDFYFFKWWKCGLIVSRGEFLIISVTTSYIKGIKNRDTFTSRISPLFCWFQFEFTEKEIFSLSVLFSPLLFPVWRMLEAGTLGPPVWSSPTTFDCVTAACIF